MTRPMRVRHVPIVLGLLAGSTAVSAQGEPPAEAEETAPAAPPTASPQPDSAEVEAALREQLEALSAPGGLTADQAAERAVATAPSLNRAAAAVAAAEAGARRAWQGFFPQLEVSARYTRLSPIDQPSFGGALLSDEELALSRGLVANVDDPDAQALWAGLLDSFGNSQSFEFPVILNNYVLRATATLPVSDLLLTILPGYRAAEAAVEVAEAQAEADRILVAHRARETYYQLARARGALVVAEKAVDQVTAHRARMATLVEAGAAAPVDLLRIEAQLAQARVAVARSQGGARMAERALQLLMHEPGAVGLGEDFAETVDMPAESVEALSQRALRDRQELQTLRSLVRAREAAIRATLGRQYPQLLVQGNVDVANPNQRIIPQVAEFRTTWDVSVILRWSPNEMGAARAQAAEAEAQLAQAREDIAALGDAVQLEVSEAHTSLEAALAARSAAQVGLVAAEAEHRVRVTQLEAGTAVTSDLLDAETALTRARLAVVDAAIEAHLARWRLTRAVGGVRAPGGS